MGGDDPGNPLIARPSPVETISNLSTTTSPPTWPNKEEGAHEGPSTAYAPLQDMEVTRKDQDQGEEKPEAEPGPVSMPLLPPTEPEPQPQQGPVPMVVDEETADNEAEEQPANPMMQEPADEKKESEPATGASREGDETKEGGAVLVSLPAAVPQDGNSEKKEGNEVTPVGQDGIDKDKEGVEPQKPEEIESLLEGSSDEEKAVIMGLFGLHQDAKASEYSVSLGEPDDPSREVRFRLKEMHESPVRGAFQIQAVELELEKLMAMIAKEKEAERLSKERIIEQQRQQIHDMRAQIQSMKRPSDSPEEEMSRLRDDLEASEQMCQDLSVHNNMLIAEMNRCKEKLVTCTQKGLVNAIPVKWFCEATEDEVRDCLTAPARGVVHKAFEAVDRIVRDTTIDPFVRENGMIVGERRTHEALKAISREYGPLLCDLIIAKKREVEKYCPSGAYPTPVLWERGNELSVSEVIQRLIDAYPKARARARTANMDHPLHRLARASSDDAMAFGASQQMAPGLVTMPGGMAMPGGVAAGGVPPGPPAAGSAASSQDGGRRPQRMPRPAQDSNQNSMFEFFDAFGPGAYASTSANVSTALDSKTTKLLREWIRDNTPLKQKKSVATALATINRVLTDALIRWKAPMAGRKLNWHDLEALLDSYREGINVEIGNTTETSVRQAWRRIINFVKGMRDAENRAMEASGAVRPPIAPQPAVATATTVPGPAAVPSQESDEDDKNKVTDASFRRGFRQWLQEHCEQPLRNAVLDSVDDFFRHILTTAETGAKIPLPEGHTPLTVEVVKKACQESRRALEIEVNALGKSNGGVLMASWALLLQHLGLEPLGKPAVAAPEVAVGDGGKKDVGRAPHAPSNAKLQAVVLSQSLRSEWISWMARESKADEASRWGYLESVNRLLATEVGHLRDASLDEIHRRLSARAKKIDQTLGRLAPDAPVQVGWRLFLEFLSQVPGSGSTSQPPHATEHRHPPPATATATASQPPARAMTNGPSGGSVMAGVATVGGRGLVGGSGSKGLGGGGRSDQMYECVKPECLQMFREYLSCRSDGAELVRDIKDGEAYIQSGVGQVLRCLGLWGGRVKNPENILSFIRLSRFEETFRMANPYTSIFLDFLLKVEQQTGGKKKAPSTGPEAVSPEIAGRYKEWLEKKGISAERYVALKIEDKLLEVIRLVNAPRFETEKDAIRFFERLTVRTITANSNCASAMFLEYLGSPHVSVSRAMLYRLGLWLSRMEHPTVTQPQQIQEIRSLVVEMVSKVTEVPLVTEEEAIDFFDDPLKRYAAAEACPRVATSFFKYLDSWVSTPQAMRTLGVPLISQSPSLSKKRKHPEDESQPSRLAKDLKKEAIPATLSGSSSATLSLTMPTFDHSTSRPITSSSSSSSSSHNNKGANSTVIIFGSPLPSSLGDDQEWDRTSPPPASASSLDQGGKEMDPASGKISSITSNSSHATPAGGPTAIKGSHPPASSAEAASSSTTTTTLMPERQQIKVRGSFKLPARSQVKVAQEGSSLTAPQAVAVPSESASADIGHQADRVNGEQACGRPAKMPHLKQEPEEGTGTGTGDGQGQAGALVEGKSTE